MERGYLILFLKKGELETNVNSIEFEVYGVPFAFRSASIAFIPC